MINFQHKIKHRLFYRSFPTFYLFEKFCYRRFQRPAASEVITSPSGRQYPIAGLVAQLQESGIAVLPGYYAPDHADALHNEIVALNEDVRSGKIPADTKGDLFSGRAEWSKVLEPQGITRIHNIQKINSMASTFHEDPNFSLVGSLYYGRSIFNLLTISQYNEPIESGCRGFHIDSHLNQFKSFIYLNDVDENNGPHDYMLGSHVVNLKNMKRAYQTMKTQDTSVTEADAHSSGFRHKTFPASKGTVLLVDTRGIHQGADLKQGHRVVLTGYYFLKEDWPQYQT